MKILLIDDSQVKIERISEYLTSINLLDLTIKKSYHSALKELLGDIKYELILLDISIPSFDVKSEFMPSGGKNLFNQIYMNGLTSKVIVITLYKSFDDGSLMENLHKQFSEEYSENYLGYIIFNTADTKWQSDLFLALKNIQ